MTWKEKPTVAFCSKIVYKGAVACWVNTSPKEDTLNRINIHKVKKMGASTLNSLLISSSQKKSHSV